MTMSYNDVNDVAWLNSIIAWCIMSCYVMLRYVLLYYIILYYITLYYLRGCARPGSAGHPPRVLGAGALEGSEGATQLDPTLSD